MSEVWLYLKKSLNCKPHLSEVHDPKANTHQHHRSSAQRKRQGKNNCSNIKDFIHGGLSRLEKQPRTPKSQASDAMLNPVTHEIVLDSTSGEIKICPCCPCYQSIKDSQAMKAPHGSTNLTIASTQTHFVDCDECYDFSRPKVTVQKDSNHEWGEKRDTLDPIEEHDISDHSVILLHREDSSWQIVEKICKASYVHDESNATQIECVMKVQNTRETFACFEERREMVRISVGMLKNKHPRCLVDGNELLRFHGTTIQCSLGVNGSSSLCTLDRCGLCQILRHGFSANQKFLGTVGVLTTSTCGKAIDSIRSSKKLALRKCVLVCRVIAGRINNPLQEIQEMSDSGYDSLVKKISGQSDIEELCALNPRAVLPCFVVIYRV